MLMLKKRLAGRVSLVAALVLAAMGVVLVIMIAGAFVYSNTRRLISASGWVEHTQEVLISLQRSSGLIDRVESSVRLYLVTGDDQQLQLARTSTNQLGTQAVHLKVLVSDNPNQTENTQDLMACAAALSRELEGFNAHGVLPIGQIQRCQQTVSLMAEQEQRLLQERTQISERSSMSSIAMEVAFVGLALLLLVIVFGLLLREAVARQRAGGQMILANEQMAQSVHLLEERAQESVLLTVARDELQLCMDIQQVYKSAAVSFSRLVPGTSGCVCMINSSRNMVEVVARWGETTVEDFSPPESCCGLRSGQPRWRQPGVSEIDCTHFIGEPPEHYLCLPIVAHGDAMGMIYLQCECDEVMQVVRARLDGLQQLVQLTGMAGATLNLQAKLENQSIRDGLTGLFNRHFMQIALERELSRAARRKDILAVCMLDVDHFKRFNDAHGHAAGDAVLKAIAGVFQGSIRAEDIACRYGGEEFTIIFPDITHEAARQRIESIRETVESLRIALERDTDGKVAVSIGVALYPNDARTVEELLRKADHALYHAKRHGRNRVSFSGMAAALERS